jgi:hypothetical protein
MSVRKALVLSAAVALALLGTAPTALASPFHHHGRGHAHQYSRSSDDGDNSGDDSPDTGQPDTVTPSADTSSSQAAAAGGTVRSGAAQTITAELTAYDFSDNQGGSNSTICCAKLHQQAGGTGTFADPITTAVPGSGGSGMQTPAGTRIYVPSLAAYFIVEDSGATPTSRTRFDLWLDGRGLSSASACMDRVTRTTTVIINPPAGKPVGHVGPLGDASGCHVTGQ